MTNDKRFFVELPSYNADNTGFYKKAILDRIRREYPWLTVAGLSDPYRTPKGNIINGVQSAGAGNLLTFGTAKHHDVNWVRRAEFAAERGYTPILNPVTNWNSVVNHLHAFAMDKKPYLPTYDRFSRRDAAYALGNDRYLIGGNNVTITRDFVYVGNQALPRTITPTVYYALPTSTRKTLAGIALIIERI